ncbi:MAG: hypothetical protein WCK59_01625 [Candidatus Falkowbacteria bacterium]
MDNNQPTVEDAAVLLLARICRTTITVIGRAFDEVDSYQIHKKHKSSGGFRIIAEPPETLKFVQKRLLIWLNRLSKRFDFYNSKRRHNNRSYDQLVYKKVLEHTIDKRLHAQRNKSISTTAAALKVHSNFLIEIDLKNAFPSVSAEFLQAILYPIFLDECNSYYYPPHQKLFYQKLMAISEIMKDKIGPPPTINVSFRYRYYQDEEFKTWKEALLKWNVEAEKLLTELGFCKIHQYQDNSWIVNGPLGESWRVPLISKDSYPHYPLFSTRTCREFRNLIREVSGQERLLEASQIPEIIDYFTKYLVRLTTFHNSLPQGAPTSGFLLNLVISEMKLPEKIMTNFGNKWNSKLAVYVDNFFITSIKKPDEKLLSNIEQVVAQTGVFQLNPKKTKVYDLRCNSGPILGMKLTQRPATEKELIVIDKLKPCGYVKAKKSSRKWLITTTTLSQKKQKQYRAFLHHVITQSVSDKEISRAEGYHGHIVSVYGKNLENLPATLRGLVGAFRMKIHKIR